MDVANYSKSFELEWKKLPIHFEEDEKRVQTGLNFPLQKLKGMTVLDAGCGSGRYTRVLRKYGAKVISIDINDTLLEDLKRDTNITYIVKDMNMLKEGEIPKVDLIISFGVLHHTPDPEKTFRHLSKFLKRGGKFAISVYDVYDKTSVYPTIFWRKIIKHIPKKAFWYISYISVPLYYLWRIKYIGWPFRVLLPMPITRRWQTRVLEFYDWYTPTYVSFHDHVSVYNWYKRAGFKNIEVLNCSVSFIGDKI
ncbi:MAG: methyltransferase domain-containing protein [Candidatus Doudnabacteria bacterium]|nr:methyltransferase domain-containing protein [Candidatus Doudnabacteria bacterium]